MTEKPKCKKHPDRDAVIRADGVSTGSCRECLEERGGAIPRTAPAKTKKASLAQVRGLVGVLRGRAETLREATGGGDLNAILSASQGVLATLDIMAEMQALPGWDE